MPTIQDLLARWAERAEEALLPLPEPPRPAQIMMEVMVEPILKQPRGFYILWHEYLAAKREHRTVSLMNINGVKEIIACE